MDKEYSIELKNRCVECNGKGTKGIMGFIGFVVMFAMVMVIEKLKLI